MPDSDLKMSVAADFGVADGRLSGMSGDERLATGVVTTAERRAVYFGVLCVEFCLRKLPDIAGWGGRRLLAIGKLALRFRDDGDV